MGKTVVVAQDTLADGTALAFAAAELCAAGDALVLLHPAAVNAGAATVMHGAPHTVATFNADGDQQQLYGRVVNKVKDLHAAAIAESEARGVPVVVKAALLDVDASARDKADAIDKAAREDHAALVVVERGAGCSVCGEQVPTPPGGAGGAPHKSASGCSLTGLGRLAKGDTLAGEILKRSGSAYAVVLVPGSWQQGSGGSGAAVGH